MASASGSISAARGRKKVGESVWMCGGLVDEVVVEGGVAADEEGRKCAASFCKRVEGGDILEEAFCVVGRRG
jgi:hypothetical protein